MRTWRPWLVPLLLGLLFVDCGSSSAPHDGRWEAIGPFGGLLLSVAVAPSAPDTVYVGGTLGVFKSTDGGATWSRANAGIESASPLSIAVDPSDASHVLISTAGPVFATSDGGQSWKVVNSDLHPQKLQFDRGNPNVVFGLALGTVYRSADGGQTWSVANQGLATEDVVSLAIAPSAPSTLYAGTVAGRLFKTSDGGNSWSQLAASGVSSSIIGLAVSPQSDTTLYVSPGAGVFRSTDGGASFTEVTGSDLSTQRVFTMTVTSAGEVYACAENGEVFKSTDGTSFSLMNLPPLQYYGIDSIPGQPSTVLIASRRGLFRTTNAGLDWAESNSGLNSIGSYTVAAVPGRPGNVLAGAEYLGIEATQDSGTHWSVVSGYPGNPRSLRFAPTDSSKLYLLDGCRVFKSIDVGLSWTDASNGLPQMVSECALEVSRSTPNTLYAVQGFYLYKSTDAAASWTRSSNGLPVATLYSIAIDPKNPDIAYVGTGISGDHGQVTPNGVYATTNGGASWSALTGAVAAQYIYSVAVSPADSARIYAGSKGVIFESADRGATWSTVTVPGAGQIRSITIDEAAPSTLYALAPNQVFKSTDGGASWRQILSGLSGFDPFELTIDASDHQLIYVASSGSGVYRSDSGGE